MLCVKEGRSNDNFLSFSSDISDSSDESVREQIAIHTKRSVNITNKTNGIIDSNLVIREDIDTSPR